ncbi:MAG: class I SAM-dependent methyltransferase [Hylemonella sp.]
MASSWYDRHVFPRLMDFACGLPLVSRQRELVVPRASGRVLEIGIGTGLNLPFYDKSRVTQIVGLEPAQHLHRLAQERIAQSGMVVELVPISAQKIDLPDRSFDTVLTTYTLCSIPEPQAAMREIRRILKPDGQLLYCEHGQAPDASVRVWQDRLQPLWGPMAGGCHLGRDMEALIREAGFSLTEPHHDYLPGPRFLSFHYWGQAQLSA